MTTAKTAPVSVRGPTKQFGRIRAVEELTFDVWPAVFAAIPEGAKPDGGGCGESF